VGTETGRRRLNQSGQRRADLRIGGGCGDLILPELDIAAGQRFQIRRRFHGGDYSDTADRCNRRGHIAFDAARAI